MTQNDRVLEFLKTGRGLDPMTAWSELGVYRLGARIFELRGKDYDIVNVGRKVRNRWGEECSVACYRLREKGRFIQTRADCGADGQMDWVATA